MRNKILSFALVVLVFCTGCFGSGDSPQNVEEHASVPAPDGSNDLLMADKYFSVAKDFCDQADVESCENYLIKSCGLYEKISADEKTANCNRILYNVRRTGVFTSNSGKATTTTIDTLPPFPVKESKSRITDSKYFGEAWQVFTKFRSALDGKDIKTANTYAYRSIDIPECEEEGLVATAECYTLIEFYTSMFLSSNLARDDFIYIEEDERQLIASTGYSQSKPLLGGEESGVWRSKSFIFFVRDPAGKLRILSTYYWSGNNEYEDSDGDGLQDGEDDVILDPDDKDSDGDGWWDGVEVNAETDADDPNDFPYQNPAKNTELGEPKVYGGKLRDFSLGAHDIDGTEIVWDFPGESQNGLYLFNLDGWKGPRGDRTKLIAYLYDEGRNLMYYGDSVCVDKMVFERELSSYGSIGFGEVNGDNVGGIKYFSLEVRDCKK